MNIEQKTNEELKQHIESLQTEVEELRVIKTVLEEEKVLIESLLSLTRNAIDEDQPRNDLLKSWITISDSSQQKALVKESLQQSLDSAIKLTGADKGSLFLLNSTGVVTDSILTRGEISADSRHYLIGTVLDRGLAGWVYREKKVGLVFDTQEDQRWLQFPDQPYVARSALSIPIARGEKDLLGIITLLHTEPNRFSMETAQLMEITVNCISLILDVASRKIEKEAFEIQTILLENLVEIASSPSLEVLKSTLQTTLDIAADRTKSEKCSLLVLNRKGEIVDAILARTNISSEQREKLIGQVLDRGLAGWVSRERELGLIVDTETDSRWVNLPDQPYITRSALAIPILRADDLLGIITLQHSEPGHYTRDIAKFMEVTAKQMALILENARLYDVLGKLNEEKERELQRGQNLQSNFLAQPLEIPNWEIATALSPAIELSGDFYDIFKLDNFISLVIADVCDKGVGSALFMALFRSLIRVFSTQQDIKTEQLSEFIQKNTPATGWLGESLYHINALKAIEQTHSYIVENHQDVFMFATVFMGILDPKTGILTYINAGHEDLYIMDQNTVKAVLKRTGPAVGAKSKELFKINQIYLNPGDILFGYTDGVTDAKNPQQEHFVTRKDRGRLLSLLDHPAGSAAELLERVQTTLEQHINGAPQFDDITLLIVRRKI